MGWPEDVWPDVAKFPQWPKMREALQGPKEQEPFQDLLRSAKVQRPLVAWPETLNLIVSLLVWNPKCGRQLTDACSMNFGAKAFR